VYTPFSCLILLEVPLVPLLSGGGSHRESLPPEVPRTVSTRRGFHTQLISASPIGRTPCVFWFSGCPFPPVSLEGQPSAPILEYLTCAEAFRFPREVCLSNSTISFSPEPPSFLELVPLPLLILFTRLALKMFPFLATEP